MLLRLTHALVILSFLLPAGLPASPRFRENTINLGVLGRAGMRPVPTSQDTQISAFTLADLGEKDIVVKTIFDQAQVSFPLAEGRQIDRAVLELHLSHGKKLLPNLSDLMIALNDEPVANLPLTAENADNNFTNVELPVTGLQSGENILTFSFNLRLRDTGCGDMGNPSLWAKIFSDTTITLDGHETPISPELSRYPAPFVTLSNLGGNSQLTIVLPPGPTPAELSAAAQIAASLGQAANWESPPIWGLTSDQLDETRRTTDHLIVIDIAGRNPLAAAVAPGLSMLVSPYNSNRLMLVVSGADEISLLESAALLTTRSARSNLTGGHIAPMQVEPLPIQVHASRMKLTDLGFNDRRVRGIGLHDLYYPIDVPYNWKTTSDASIELHFIHGRGLASASLMSAYVNGFKVADIALTNRNDTNGQLMIRLSPRQIHPGRNWLHLSFNLHVRREDCNFRYLNEVWLEVSASSSVLNLAHVASKPPLDLSYLPSPLVTPLDLSNDLFVLPAQPGLGELTVMARLAAKLGTYANIDGLRPLATTADRFDAKLSPKASVIAIGTPETNALLAKYDSQLPQPLSTMNGVLATTGGRELLPEEQSGEAGYIQLLTAPWSGRAVLVVLSAPSVEQLLITVDAWPTLGRRFKSQGNVAVVTAVGVVGLNLGGLAGAPLPGSTRVTLSVILLGAFIMIGGVGLVVSRRKRAKEQEKKDADE